MKPLQTYFITTLLILISFTSVAQAHFGAIIPSDDIISARESHDITLAAKFIHPMERHFMEMERPAQFGVLHQGKKLNLLHTVTKKKGNGPDQKKKYTFWESAYKLTTPGDYTFFLEPKPYWEPSEDLFIIHFTKVCVNFLGLEDGWDQPTGLQTEIIPLSRPYGLWTGNLFTGQVLLNGKPVPHAEVEIEYLNDSPKNKLSIVAPPSLPFITQVVKADSNGVFSYAMPKAGWWGFSALNTADWTIRRNNEEKNVEIGAVFWVKTTDIQ